VDQIWKWLSKIWVFLPYNVGAQTAYFRLFFYRAASMQGGLRLLAIGVMSVCLSVYLSNAWYVTKRKKTCAHIFIPHERAFIQFSGKKNVWWGRTPCTWNFGSNWHYWSVNADLESIFLRSASAVTPNEKVHLTLIGSPLRVFQRA